MEDEYLSKECKTCVILEAKFNDEVLQSDPIEINSPNPELATELGFRVNKKDFHQFRIERKSIKLQCYIEYSTTTERTFVGYVVLNLRDAQEYAEDPKYKWLVLLNPKYKGTSSKRPQLYLAFMTNKLAENIEDDSEESKNQISEVQFTRSIKKDHRDNLDLSLELQESSSRLSELSDFDTNLKVKYKNKYFHIWDENKCQEKDCLQLFLVHIQIDKPKHLLNLFNDKEKQLDTAFFFKYTIFGQQIKSNIFYDLFNSQDFKKHKHLFQVLTFDKEMLKSYFEHYPNLEIQLCDTDQTLVGFVALNLLRLFQQSTLQINSDYMVI